MRTPGRGVDQDREDREDHDDEELRREAEPEPQHHQRDDGDERRRVERVDQPVGRRLHGAVAPDQEADADAEHRGDDEAEQQRAEAVEEGGGKFAAADHLGADTAMAVG